ncbi:MAG: Nif3-like dinuclear metal center hexameric protein [Thiotrichaceae bacterium]|nr:Nif3-like dinuclear metal center hexameric protein [Thiotrichaceae bacterium]
MVTLTELVSYTNDLLNIDRFKDYTPNGLQLEGKQNINKLATGVTASLDVINKAVDMKADALLVHHGYFWTGEDQTIIGLKKKRLALLIKHDISLIAYHLPLDAHPEYGNNACLGKMFGLKITDVMDKQGIGNIGTFDEPITLSQFVAKVSKILSRQALLISAGDHPIKRIAWCSGGAQKYLMKAAAMGADLYLSGEISENTVHEAREIGVHYIAAGHHATERYGVQALAQHLATIFSIEHEYIESDNPA